MTNKFIEACGKYATAKIFADSLETNAMGQLIALCAQPFADGATIRIMPDAHAGSGCVIGTTMTVGNGMIVPNLVGVDIGCGMEVVRIGKYKPDFQKLDKVIRESVPSGFSLRDKEHEYIGYCGLDKLRCAHVIKKERAAKSIGTLGGGNHFIELAYDEKTDDHYLIIHSGSRNPGLTVANHYQKIADAKREQGIPKGLAPLSGQDFEDYVHDMRIMQEYADWNRKAISNAILNGMKWKANDFFTTVHNYLDTENMILRKGAVSAASGEVLLIPMNMRDGSLLCVGKGNADWNYSAPHGAGRICSRSAAKEMFTLTQFKEDMEGIWTSCVSRDTIDENPRAYKPMQDILDHIGDTVDVQAILKPVYNFKASEQKIGKGKKRND